jgi:tetratricopeptide (TPR) repeat protein
MASLQAKLSFLGLLLLVACTLGRGTLPRGPSNYEEAAALAPEGKQRASIHLVARADEALARGSLGPARDLASRAIRLNGHNAYAYFVLGQVAAASGEHEAALRYLDQAKILFEPADPPNPLWIARVLRAKADLLEQGGNLEEARRVREEAQALEADEGSSGSGPGPVLDSLP